MLPLLLLLFPAAPPVVTASMWAFYPPPALLPGVTPPATAPCMYFSRIYDPTPPPPLFMSIVCSMDFLLLRVILLCRIFSFS